MGMIGTTTKQIINSGNSKGSCSRHPKQRSESDRNDEKDRHIRRKKEDDAPPNLLIQRNEPGRRKQEGSPKICGAHDRTEEKIERESELTRRKQYERDWEKREKVTGTRL
jgi:hypothetical protein